MTRLSLFPFSRSLGVQAARELGHLMRDKPQPEETGAFPAEKGVLLTPEEQATVGRKNARREKR